VPVLSIPEHPTKRRATLLEHPRQLVGNRPRDVRRFVDLVRLECSDDLDQGPPLDVDALLPGVEVRRQQLIPRVAVARRRAWI